MGMETMAPTPTWDAAAHEETVATFERLRDEITVHVWGGDWCPDCRSQLPDFAAALAAADVPDDAVHQHALDRDKEGDLVAEYGIEFIPTVVVERDGEELARFVESADRPIAAALAEQLSSVATEQ
jgi:thioredoxin 1